MADYETVMDYRWAGETLVESVTIRRTTDLDTYPSGWDYSCHLGTVDGLTLLRYDTAHELTKGHERHTAIGDEHDRDFPGMETLLVSFWASADEYWEIEDETPPRPY